MDQLVDTYELARQHERQPAHDMALLMIDLDGYKAINDTYGHGAGDEVLVKIREVLQSACRESDELIRWGGDEFMVTGRTTDPHAVAELAERIRAAVEACRFEFDGGATARLSCSIGFACFPFVSAAPRLLTWDQVLALADRALYASKNTGRNAWVGILASNRVPTDAHELLAAIERDPEALVAEEIIEVVTSISSPLRWDKDMETLRA
jgi:diguanylate cyclase (GGDEF)-like protein